MPDPMTAATSSPVPSASAVGLRASSRFHSAAAARSPTPGADAQHIASSAGLDGAELAGRHLDVGENGVDLPRLAVGRVDPDLVLHREATRHLVLGRGGEPLAGRGEPARRPTSSVDSTSTPRWFSVPGSPAPSMRTSFSGGSAMAKLA